MVGGSFTLLLLVEAEELSIKENEDDGGTVSSCLALGRLASERSCGCSVRLRLVLAAAALPGSAIDEAF